MITFLWVISLNSQQIKITTLQEFTCLPNLLWYGTKVYKKIYQTLILKRIREHLVNFVQI